MTSSTCDSTPASQAISPFELLCTHSRETSLLASIEALLGWDERTQLPPAAAEFRAEQVTYLTGLIHRRQTDPRVGDWIAAAQSNGAAADPQSDRAVILRQLKRQYDRKTRLPQALVEELARTAVLGQQAWVEARKNNDFATFRPWLEKTFELKRQQADALGFSVCRYDALLDEFEPGESTANVTQILAALRDELVPLVEAIASCEHKPDLSILKRYYPLAAQETLGRMAAQRIGFEFNRGRLDVTAHPFCTEAGPHDCRITTRFDEHFFAMAFFGILHEAGHGIYEQGLRSDQYGLPLGQYVSMGIHESQSRMWENLVGRSRPFWQFFFPEAQRLFPEALGQTSLDQFYFAINDVRPSLVRVEADEVTYNLHIIIRFELEQALLSGEIAMADLPAAWNAKYKQYLGIEPTSDAEGVLQDIHWGAGLVGYFPTYSLGNLYAAQFFSQAERDLGGLADSFALGEFASLRSWLNENIHAHGQRYTAAELVQRVTGKPLGHKDLIDYLLNKMEPLYSRSPAPAPTATVAAEVAQSESAALEVTSSVADDPSSAPSQTATVGVAAGESDAAAATYSADAATSDVAGEPAVPEKLEPSSKADVEEASDSESISSLETMTEVVPDHPWLRDLEPASIDANFDAGTLRTQPRAQEYQVGAVGNLIGIVVFGFVGLALGYWLLNFFGGERFNFLDIWLPFL